MHSNDNAIKRSLEKLGAALSGGDARTAAECWAVPGLVLSDQGAVAISGLEEVERFFAQAIGSYRARGIVSTRPDIRNCEPLSDTLAAVDVDWPGFDGEGKEVSRERSFYIVRLRDDGGAQVQAALTRTLRR